MAAGQQRKAGLSVRMADVICLSVLGCLVLEFNNSENNKKQASKTL